MPLSYYRQGKRIKLQKRVSVYSEKRRGNSTTGRCRTEAPGLNSINVEKEPETISQNRFWSKPDRLMP